MIASRPLEWAFGANALTTVTSLTDPGEIYQVDEGGELLLTATPHGSPGPVNAGFYYQNSHGTNQLPSGTFAFEAPGGTVTSLLSNVAIGDSIALPGSDVASVTYGANSLSVVTNLGTTTFSDVTYLAGATPTGYTVSADPSGLERITFANEDGAPCYCRGTLIATAHGEVPVETLEIGNNVTTKSGTERPIKWIGRRSYGGRFLLGRKDILPVCIKAGALDENVPRRDLWISPHHAMFLRGILIEAKDLVNGVSIVQTDCVEKVEYFHIELDAHDVIFAEGAWSESFVDDDSRGMFHNAHEYRTLYPQEAATGLARYCAPRHEDGYEVEAARQRIALRAGLWTSDDERGVGVLRGYIDLASPCSIAGWAQNVDYPEAPVCLDIYAGGRLIGQTLANRYRQDLEHAGLGSGHHSFEFIPPAELAQEYRAVEVRRSLDGAL
jgi:hypothetical protein